MKKKLVFIILIILNLFIYIEYLSAAELKKSNIIQSQNYSNEIATLKNRINELDSLYKNVIESAKISLDFSRFATSSMSIASFIFVVISFMLAFFGIKELKGISDIKKETTRDINLVRHFSLAEMFLKSGQNPAAAKELEEVLKIDPNNLVAHIQLGFLYTDIFKDKAIFHSKKAAEIDPYNFVAHLNWGVNLDHTPAPKKEVAGIYEIAERLGEEQRVDDVSLGKAKRFLAASYEAMGEKQKAIAKYEEAKKKLENAKKSGLSELAKNAEYWSRDLDDIIKRLKEER